MASRFEFEGKNVESALKNASKKLNIDEKNIQYDVLSYGSTGIFGLVGIKKAKIRVILEDPKGRDEEAPKDMEQTPLEMVPRETGPREENIQENSDGDFGNPKEIGETGRSFLKMMVSYISKDTTIAMDIKGQKIAYVLSGKDSGMLIGKKGQTLDALQYLLEKMVKKTADTKVNITIDIEGYLETRKDNLNALAMKLSNKAKKTGKPITVGHMSSQDRRIIHMALKNDKNVRTQSMGDGQIKKIVIFPKKRTLAPNKAEPSTSASPKPDLE